MLTTYLNRLFPLAQRLALNAVPAWGVFAQQWTPATALALYWCETVLAMALIAARIALHRRWTGKQGHFTGGEMRWSSVSNGQRTTGRSQSSFLSGFLMVGAAFTLVHGVFLAVLLFADLPILAQSPMRVDGSQLQQGLLAIALLLLVDFGFDLRGLQQQPFAWVRRLAELFLSRIIVVHLTIMLGMVALFFTGQPRGLFAVFVVLKTLADLSGRVPQYDPAEPPGWLVSLMQRLRLNDGFEAYWREESATRERGEMDDEVVKGS